MPETVQGRGEIHPKAIILKYHLTTKIQIKMNYGKTFFQNKMFKAITEYQILSIKVIDSYTAVRPLQKNTAVCL